MNRAEFLSAFLPKNNFEEKPPLGGLEQYSGAWTQKQVIHLLRRTTFGVKKSEVDTLVASGLNGAIAALLDTSGTKDPIPSPPLNLYSTTAVPDPTTPYGQTFVDANPLTTIPPEYYQARTNMLKAWWTGNLIHQKMTITEKMTLFWFNHFAIEADTVQIAQGVYYYYKLLRDNALGNFKTLVKLVSVHPAMLLYLNGYKNSKTAPDENYGRELQELFTIGKGVDSKYTESDVKAAARVLTGFRINPLTTPISYYFDPSQHDTTDKTFSSFYGNKKITGKQFLAGEQELDELITMLLDNIETARHLCRKLYQYFIYYEITPEAETNVIIPLADFFKSSGYDIKSTVEKLLKSAHFYDEDSIGCVIKSPLEYCVGLCKTFSIAIPDSTQKEAQYVSWGIVAGLAASQGQNIADPPVVSGWQAWYQVPQFHRIWINADTLGNKNKAAEALFSSNGVVLLNISIKIDVFKFFENISDKENATSVVTESVALLYNYPLSTTSINYFKNYLTGGNAMGETYWTQIVLEYKNNPNDTNKSQIETRLKPMLKEIVVQAEYHLS